MKSLLIIAVCLLVTAVLLFFVLSVMSRSGKTPGLSDNRLLFCPDTPNCVCSEYQDDNAHYIDPFALSDAGSSDDLAELKLEIQNMGGDIVVDQDAYLASTFSSRLFGFVDDLEIRVDRPTGLIHIRSASRVGHGDAGINRKRVERLRSLYKRRDNVL